MSTSRLRSDVERPLQVGAQLIELDLVAVQLGLLFLQLLLDDRLAVAQHRDLADQLIDLIAVVLDRGREGALAVVHAVESVALVAELRLQVLAGRGGAEADGEQGRGRGQEDADLLRAGTHAEFKG